MNEISEECLLCKLQI